MEQKVETLPERVNQSLPSLSIESNPVDMIKYALDKGVTVDVMERMLAMRKELQIEAAKREFDRSMKEFQSECPIVLKEKAVPDRSGKPAYSYAPIEAIEVQIRPFLRKHGFSHTFDQDVKSVQGWVIAKCIVKHELGHSETVMAQFPLGTRTAIMSETQVYAAALTFANRRALCNAYGLILAGEDMDGQTGRLKPKAPSKLAVENDELKPAVQILWTLLRPVRGEAMNYEIANKWLRANKLIDDSENIPDEITLERCNAIINTIRALVKNGELK